MCVKPVDEHNERTSREQENTTAEFTDERHSKKQSCWAYGRDILLVILYITLFDSALTHFILEQLILLLGNPHR